MYVQALWVSHFNVLQQVRDNFACELACLKLFVEVQLRNVFASSLVSRSSMQESASAVSSQASGEVVLQGQRMTSMISVTLIICLSYD